MSVPVREVCGNGEGKVFPDKTGLQAYYFIITNYSQQDATFLECIYFYRRSTCFRRFLRSSSGAHNCTYSFRYCQAILLLSVTVEEMGMKFHLLHGSS
jgi:hypothetical protein